MAKYVDDCPSNKTTVCNRRGGIYARKSRLFFLLKAL